MANKNSIAKNLIHRAKLKEIGKPIDSSFNSKTSKRKQRKDYKRVASSNKQS